MVPQHGAGRGKSVTAVRPWSSGTKGGTVEHPFSGLDHRALWLAGSWLATVVLMAILSIQGGRLATPQAPRGILSLEFAWNGPTAERMIASWPGPLRERAKRQIWIDFAFLAVYPLAFSLSCARMSESLPDTLAPVGVFVAWAVLLAGPLDLVENVAMLRMLASGASDALARLAAWCAGIKFTLICAAVGYLALQGLAVGLSRFRS